MIAAAVVVAGIVGAVIRFLVSRAFAPRTSFPWAVLVVNVVGSGIGGVVVALWTDAGLSSDWRLILLTGFCGGLTTFSTFSVETVQLLTSGRARVAVWSIAANLVLGVGAAAVAYAVTAALAR
jgi:CrcB protein